MNTCRKQSEALGCKSHTDSSVYVNLEKQIHAKHMVSQKELLTLSPSAYPRISDPWGKVVCLLWAARIKRRSEFLTQYKSKSNESKRPFPVLILLLSWPPWPTCSAKAWKRGVIEGDETWKPEKRKKRTKNKRVCATSNSEYLRVKYAQQVFFSPAGPWECSCLALCLGKCVPYVFSRLLCCLHRREEQLAELQEEGASGLKECCCFFSYEGGQRAGGFETLNRGSVVQPEHGRSRNPPPPHLPSTTNPTPTSSTLTPSPQLPLTTFETSRLAFK